MEIMNNMLETIDVKPKSNPNRNPNEPVMMMTYEEMREAIQRSAVVVFSLGECCMCHVAKHLLLGLGAAPNVVELDSPLDIQHLTGEQRVLQLPVIFVGGKLLGGIESLMACHINGSLVPLLKDAGALWL